MDKTKRFPKEEAEVWLKKRQKAQEEAMKSKPRPVLSVKLEALRLEYEKFYKERDKVQKELFPNNTPLPESFVRSD